MNLFSKLLTHNELSVTLERHRQHAYKITATSGCFDLLHVGHVRFLTAACGRGDLLVVCLNSDASVRALKGEGRPLIPVGERVEMLQALTVVSYITIFDELTPECLIERIKPDTWLKGSDYLDANLPEHTAVEKHGGKVVILPELSKVRTSTLLDRLRVSNDSNMKGEEIG
jgi:D-beta-D-heptose 7-phosphate kinase/D-beta-D-heptose 1-phosphate adenosyltransferase